MRVGLENFPEDFMISPGPNKGAAFTDRNAEESKEALDKDSLSIEDDMSLYINYFTQNISWILIEL